MSRVSWIGLVGLLLARSAVATPSGTPVSIAHDALKCWPKDEFVFVKANVLPPTDVRTLKLYYRAEQHAFFYYVDMSVNALGQAVAVVPIAENGTAGIVYFIELVTTGFNAVRTEELRVPVMTASQCRDAAPDLLFFSGDQPNITVGATRAGATKIPPGFKANGISKFIDSAGIVVTEGGGSKLPYVLGGVGGGAAAAALALTAGKNSEVDTSLPPVGGATTSVGVITTTSTPNSTTTTSVSGSGGSSTTTVPTNNTTTVPGPTTTTTTGPTTTTTTSSTTTTTIGPTTTTTSSTTTTTIGPTTTTTSSSTTTAPATSTTTTSSTTTTTAPSTTTTSAASTTTTTSVASGADLQVTKSDSPDPVTVGQQIIYTVTVRNNGPGTATDVILRDDLPPEVTVLLTQGGCGGGQVIQCSWGTMPSGDSRQALIYVRADSVGTISNEARVFATSNDPNPGNNMTTETTRVVMALRTSPSDELQVVYKTTLSAGDRDGRVRGRVLVNNIVQETDSAAVRIHHTKVHSGENRFEAHLEPGIEADGFWRFDFSASANFVPGSLRVESGRVLSLDGHSVVFALPAAGEPLRFTCELR